MNIYKPLAYYSDLGDVEIIEYEGKPHLFHLILQNRDFVGHAVSDDGLSWKALPPAIRTGDPGNYDDDMIRTVSVTRHQDQFYMLYSATSRKLMENGISEGGRIERFGVATSKDLISWKKERKFPLSKPIPDSMRTKLKAEEAYRFEILNRITKMGNTIALWMPEKKKAPFCAGDVRLF